MQKLTRTQFLKISAVALTLSWSVLSPAIFTFTAPLEISKTKALEIGDFKFSDTLAQVQTELNKTEQGKAVLEIFGQLEDEGSYLMPSHYLEDQASEIEVPSEIPFKLKLRINVLASKDQIVALLPEMILRAQMLQDLMRADGNFKLDQFRVIFNCTVRPADACMQTQSYAFCGKKFGASSAWIALLQDQKISLQLDSMGLKNTVHFPKAVEPEILDLAERTARNSVPIKAYYKSNFSPIFADPEPKN